MHKLLVIGLKNNRVIVSVGFKYGQECSKIKGWDSWVRNDSTVLANIASGGRLFQSLMVRGKKDFSNFVPGRLGYFCVVI